MKISKIISFATYSTFLAIIAMVILSTIYYSQQMKLSFRNYNHLKAYIESSNINEYKVEKPYINAFGETNKDYTEPFLISNRLIIDNYFDKDDIKYYFHNETSIKRDFSIYNQINESTEFKIAYNDSLQQIEFVIPEHSVSLEGKDYTTKKLRLYTISEFNRDNIIKIGNRFIDPFSNTDTVSINHKDLIEGPIEIYSKESDNLIADQNPSFEDELWTQEVENCSRDEAGKPELKMNLSQNSYEGNNSLQLISKNQNACSGKRFSLNSKKNDVFSLKFNYKNNKGNKVNVYYKLETEILGDKVSPVTGENILVGQEEFLRVPVNSKDWNNAQFFIENELDDPVSNLLLFAYANSNGYNEVDNLYDNFSFVKYNFSKNAEIKKVNEELHEQEAYEIIEKINIKPGETNLNTKNTQNLIKDYNFSFEDGLWKQNVDSCGRSTDTTRLQMKQSRESSHGNKSLFLSSEGGKACSSILIPISLKSDKFYNFKFDYFNFSGGNASFYVGLVSGNKVEEEVYENGQLIKKESLETDGSFNIVDTKQGAWSEHSHLIKPEISNINAIVIFFYANSDGIQQVKNLYDNVRLEEFAPKDIDNYYLYSEQEVDESPKVDSLEYTNLDRYTHKVRLNGLEDSTLVYFPEGYSDSWKAFPIQTDEPPEEQNVSDFTVPQEESNRQANSQEVRAYLDQGKVSTVGDKYIGKNFDGSIRNDNLKPGGTLDVLGKQAIDSSRHYKLNDYGNAWYIDVEEYCKNRNVCVDNGDGTFDLELIIRHDNKFYLQLIQASSLLSFLIPIGWLTRKKILPKINNKPSLFENTNKDKLKEKPPVKEINPESDYKESKETNNEKKNEYFEKYINREGEPIELTGDEKPNPKNSISTQKIKKSEGKKTISTKSFRIAGLIGTSDSKETSEPIEKQTPSSKKYVDLVIEPRKKSKDIRRLSSDESKSIKTVPVEDNSDELD